VLALRKRDLVCQQAVELVTNYLEFALSKRERRRFEAHLRYCKDCATYVEQIELIIRLTGSMEPDDLSPQARTDLAELYLGWLAE
jgi:hypothetical protein